MSSKKKTGGGLGGGSVVRRVEPQGEAEQCKKLIELHAVGSKICLGPWIPTCDESGRFVSEVVWTAIDVFELSRWKRAAAYALAREAQAVVLRKNYRRQSDLAAASLVQAFVVGVMSTSESLINSSSLPRVVFSSLHSSTPPIESRGRGIRDRHVRKLHENFHVLSSSSSTSSASSSLRDLVGQLIQTRQTGLVVGQSGQASFAEGAAPTKPVVASLTICISGDISSRAEIVKTASRVLRDGELKSGIVGASEIAPRRSATCLSGREEVEAVKTAVFEVEFTSLMLKHAELFTISSDTPSLRPKDDPNGLDTRHMSSSGGVGANRPRRPPTGVSPEDAALRRMFLSAQLGAYRHGHAWDVAEEQTLVTVLKSNVWETSAFLSSALFTSLPSLASSPMASPQPGAVFPSPLAGGGILVNWNFAAVLFALQQGAARGGRLEFSKSANQCDRKLKTKPELLDEFTKQPAAQPALVARAPLNLSKLSTKSAKDLFLACGAGVFACSRPANMPPTAFLALERRGAITKKPPVLATTPAPPLFGHAAGQRAARRGRWPTLSEALDVGSVCAGLFERAVRLEEKVQSGLVECMIEKKRVTSLTTVSIAFSELIANKHAFSEHHISFDRLLAQALPSIEAAAEVVKGPCPRQTPKKPGRADRPALSVLATGSGPRRPSVSNGAAGTTGLLGLMSQPSASTAPMSQTGQSPRPAVVAAPKRKIATKSEGGGGLSVAAINSTSATSPSFVFAKQAAIGGNPPNIPPVAIPPVSLPALSPAPSSARPTRRATLVKKEKN